MRRAEPFRLLAPAPGPQHQVSSNVRDLAQQQAQRAERVEQAVPQYFHRSQVMAPPAPPMGVQQPNAAAEQGYMRALQAGQEMEAYQSQLHLQGMHAAMGRRFQYQQQYQQQQQQPQQLYMPYSHEATQMMVGMGHPHYGAMQQPYFRQPANAFMAKLTQPPAVAGVMGAPQPGMPLRGFNGVASPPAGATLPRRQAAGGGMPPPPSPTPAMYDFVRVLQEHYAGHEDVLLNFYSICERFQTSLITAEEFYLAMYHLLDRTHSLQFLPQFEAFLPPAWEGRGTAWIRHAIGMDDAVEQPPSEAFLGASTAGASNATKRQTEQESERPAKARKRAQVMGQDDEHINSNKESLIVKLPVRSHGKAKLTKTTAQKKTFQPQQDGNRNIDHRLASDSDGAGPTPTKAKKRPVNGFKSSERLPPPTTSTVQQISNDQERQSISTPSSSIPSLGSHVSGTSLQAQPANLTTLPQTTLDELASDRPLPKVGKLKRLSALPSAQVPHFGPVYPTRRAVLAREDRPYIHGICGQGFKHPEDVKTHHMGSGRKHIGCAAIRAAVAKEGKTAKSGFAEWDSHESCAVGYQAIKYAAVEGGYVILNQVSWDKLNRAIKAGRDFAKKQRKDSGVEEANANAEETSDVGFSTQDATAEHETGVAIMGAMSDFEPLHNNLDKHHSSLMGVRTSDQDIHMQDAAAAIEKGVATTGPRLGKAPSTRLDKRVNSLRGADVMWNTGQDVHMTDAAVEDTSTQGQHVTPPSSELKSPTDSILAAIDFGLGENASQPDGGAPELTSRSIQQETATSSPAASLHKGGVLKRKVVTAGSDENAGETSDTSPLGDRAKK